MSKTLTYLFDPLCDWCYGINQALARLVESTGVALALLPSGQFSGNGARPMSTALAGHAWTNDLHIEQLTGLPFSTRYRDRVLGSQQPLDSTLPTLALTAVSLTTPCREFEALQGLQHARYAGGQNVTDPAVVAALLEEMGLAEAALGMQRPTDALQAAHRSRIDTARALMQQHSARGVPAFIFDDGHYPAHTLCPADPRHLRRRAGQPAVTGRGTSRAPRGDFPSGRIRPCAAGVYPPARRLVAIHQPKIRG